MPIGPKPPRLSSTPRDGVLAYFGWSKAYEDQSERAVRAGLEAVRFVAALVLSDSSTLRARVGIATGRVVVGDLVGESGRDAEAVTGETPNLVARLQSIAAPDQVIVGQATRRTLGEIFDLEDLGAVPLKDFDEAVRAWRVVGARSVESRFEARQGGDPIRLVSRKSELALLLERWELAKGGEGQTVLVSGEAGIGKSRLTDALARHVAGESHFRIQLPASPHHTNTPLRAVAQNLLRSAGIVDADPATVRLDKLEGLLDSGGVTEGRLSPSSANCSASRTSNAGVRWRSRRPNRSGGLSKP